MILYLDKMAKKDLQYRRYIFAVHDFSHSYIKYCCILLHIVCIVIASLVSFISHGVSSLFILLQK